MSSSLASQCLHFFLPLLLSAQLGLSEDAKNPETRLAALQVLAENSDAAAEFELSRIYLRGEEGVASDPKRAFQYVKRAAEHGHVEALGGVGYFYASGLGVERDQKEALIWFQRGAEKGSPKAQLNFGQMLRTGKGNPGSEEEGWVWIEKAAQSGLPDAQLVLGELYLLGDQSRQPDPVKARDLLGKLAEASNSSAQNMLGVACRDGLGGEPNSRQAEEWFRKAAEANNAKAQSNLAHLIGLESQNPQQKIEAWKWLILASEQEEPTAKKSLQELQPMVPSSLMVKAKKEAIAFRKAHLSK